MTELQTQKLQTPSKELLKEPLKEDINEALNMS